jgi:peroxiredoxin
MGLRACRYALVAENGVVKRLNVEEGENFGVSSAETILAAL